MSITFDNSSSAIASGDRIFSPPASNASQLPDPISAPPVSTTSQQAFSPSLLETPSDLTPAVLINNATSSTLFENNPNSLAQAELPTENRSVMNELRTEDVVSIDQLTGMNLEQGTIALPEPTKPLTAASTLRLGNASANNQSLLKNSGFEQGIDFNNFDPLKGWIVTKTGRVRDYDRTQVQQGKPSVATLEAIPGQSKQLKITLPQEATDNYADQIALRQDLRNLDINSVYEVSASVKWLNPGNKLPDAIVSFWSKNADGSYNGKDFRIKDGKYYKTISFQFVPNQRNARTQFFLGLFTHINGSLDDTTVLVDDYTVKRVGPVPVDRDTRRGNLLADGGFDTYKANNQFPPNNRGWYKSESQNKPAGLQQTIVSPNNNDKLRLTMPKAPANNKDANNTKFTGVFQTVSLNKGQRYRLSANFTRVGLDQLGSKRDTIVQFQAYYKDPDTGQEVSAGPIDVVLTDGKPTSRKQYFFTPLKAGNYVIRIALGGWANEGNGMTVDVDNVNLRAVP